jgi:hypothetical protein
LNVKVNLQRLKANVLDAPEVLQGSIGDLLKLVDLGNEVIKLIFANVEYLVLRVLGGN